MQTAESQEALAGGTVEPSGHAGHVVLPALAWAVPASQSLQATLPVVAEKDPGGQSEQRSLPGFG
ncbi:MAG TPA: hypothetical protein VFX03_01785 [Thermomicrobiales bacterium]|nr:hypothetical protein [Thermomicrobiales bacterium]